ncbi:hypothetical protein ACFSSG_02260 [Euzebyella marina]|nr:hypothetical protein [Euzebyella marina]
MKDCFDIVKEEKAKILEMDIFKKSVGVNVLVLVKLSNLSIG